LSHDLKPFVVLLTFAKLLYHKGSENDTLIFTNFCIWAERSGAYTTIVLPTTQSGTTRVRKAGKPEESQRRLYEIWGINWQALPTLKTRHHSGGATHEDSSIL
jgi:hypothetical protein